MANSRSEAADGLQKMGLAFQVLSDQLRRAGWEIAEYAALFDKGWQQIERALDLKDHEEKG